MIKEALNFVQKSINDYLGGASDTLVQGNIAFAHDNSVEGDFMKKKLVLSLVNLEEDRMAKTPVPYRVEADVTYHQNPAVHLNAYLLFTANYDRYEDAMAALSALIGFFQQRNVFNQGLAPGIEKLVFELYSMNLEQVHHLWGMLGGKYIPSVLYQMRMISIQHISESPASVVRKIKTVQNIR